MENQARQRRGFFAELRRRHVVRTALAYAAMVFVVLQLGEIVFPAFQTNAEADHLIRILVVGAVLLFPVVVVMAWVYEITPMGIRSMAEVDSEAGIEPHGSLSHRAALMGITMAAVAGAAFWWQQTAEWVPDTRGIRTGSVFQGAQTTDARGPVASLAVLPLEDLTGEPGQEYFAPGMHEALLSELGQIDFLRVISRTSVMQYEPGGRSVSQIGRDLNVDAIVEGSVLRAEGRVRITLQLIHAASDTHLWSRSYDREMANVIDLQREVAEAVATEVRTVLQDRSPGATLTRLAGADPAGEASPGPGGGDSATVGSPVTDAVATGGRSDENRTGEATDVQPVPGTPTVPEVGVTFTGQEFEPELQEAFMRGRVALFRHPAAEGAQAEEFFRTVLEADSFFVPALAGLAGALLTEAGDSTAVTLDRIETAREMASRAVRLAPEDREALEVLRSTEEALRVLKGTGGEVHITAPSTQLGQLVQEHVARIEVREASGDPRSGVRSFVRLVAAGHLDDARELGESLVDGGADDLALWEGLEQVHRLREDAEGLVEVRVRRREVRGREAGGSVREMVEAMEQEGARGYWTWKLREARARERDGLPVYNTSLATAQVALGEREAALETLREAVAAREPGLATLRHDPVWDGMRGDPAFQSVVRTLRTREPIPPDSTPDG